MIEAKKKTLGGRIMRLSSDVHRKIEKQDREKGSVPWYGNRV